MADNGYVYGNPIYPIKSSNGFTPIELSVMKTVYQINLNIKETH